MCSGYHPGNPEEARGEIEDLTTIKRMDVLSMFLEATLREALPIGPILRNNVYDHLVGQMA